MGRLCSLTQMESRVAHSGRICWAKATEAEGGGGGPSFLCCITCVFWGASCLPRNEWWRSTLEPFVAYIPPEGASDLRDMSPLDETEDVSVSQSSRRVGRDSMHQQQTIVQAKERWGRSRARDKTCGRACGSIFSCLLRYQMAEPAVDPEDPTDTTKTRLASLSVRCDAKQRTQSPTSTAIEGYGVSGQM